jgi:SAM-dependent methyltransferase
VESLTPAAGGRPDGLPPDYYRRMHEVEERHWWHRGMRAITRALLADVLEGKTAALLDAGCGTGGFLRWAADLGPFSRLAGTDVSAEAIELARDRVPEADLHVAPLREIPFETSTFDLVVVNDVIQHVNEAELDESLSEMRRILRPAGTLLVRTNGERQARREHAEWRIYDRASLAALLEGAGFRLERLTYGNMIMSLVAAARGRSPRPPTEKRHGIPPPAPTLPNAIAYGLLLVEARYLRHASRSLPFGHTLLALASPDSGEPKVVSGIDS